MTVRQPRYSKEEAARRGDEIYDWVIRAQVEPEHNEKIVAIDLDTGQWELDPDEDVAANRLQARLPDAQIMVIRVGSRYVRRFGARRFAGRKPPGARRRVALRSQRAPMGQQRRLASRPSKP